MTTRPFTTRTLRFNRCMRLIAVMTIWAYCLAYIAPPAQAGQYLAPQSGFKLSGDARAVWWQVQALIQRLQVETDPQAATLLRQAINDLVQEESWVYERNAERSSRSQIRRLRRMASRPLHLTDTIEATPVALTIDRAADGVTESRIEDSVGVEKGPSSAESVRNADTASGNFVRRWLGPFWNRVKLVVVTAVLGLFLAVGSASGSYYGIDHHYDLMYQQGQPVATVNVGAWRSGVNALEHIAHEVVDVGSRKNFNNDTYLGKEPYRFTVEDNRLIVDIMERMKNAPANRGKIGPLGEIYEGDTLVIPGLDTELVRRLTDRLAPKGRPLDQGADVPETEFSDDNRISIHLQAVESHLWNSLDQFDDAKDRDTRMALFVGDILPRYLMVFSLADQSHNMADIHTQVQWAAHDLEPEYGEMISAIARSAPRDVRAAKRISQTLVDDHLLQDGWYLFLVDENTANGRVLVALSYRVVRTMVNGRPVDDAYFVEPAGSLGLAKVDREAAFYNGKYAIIFNNVVTVVPRGMDARFDRGVEHLTPAQYREIFEDYAYFHEDRHQDKEGYGEHDANPELRPELEPLARSSDPKGHVMILRDRLLSAGSQDPEYRDNYYNTAARGIFYGLNALARSHILYPGGLIVLLEESIPMIRSGSMRYMKL